MIVSSKTSGLFSPLAWVTPTSSSGSEIHSFQEHRNSQDMLNPGYWFWEKGSYFSPVVPSRHKNRVYQRWTKGFICKSKETYKSEYTLVVKEGENNKQNCSEKQAKSILTGENKTESSTYLTYQITPEEKGVSLQPLWTINQAQISLKQPKRSPVRTMGLRGALNRPRLVDHPISKSLGLHQPIMRWLQHTRICMQR